VLTPHDDRTPVANDSDWFATITGPTPSDLDDARLVDRAIAAAFATDAEIIVVPRLAMMDGPVAATLRW
jgi:hypothetical protein